MSLSRKNIKKLQQIVGSDNISTKKEDLHCYSYDASSRLFMPDAVIFPKDTAEISGILKYANSQKFPVVPRGGGTGNTGGSVPTHGGVVISTSRMNSILEIDTDNLVARVQPGVFTGVFHEAAEKLGLLYPPDPSSSAYSTLGGNLAECAGGPRAVKYGVTRDYVMGLEAVLPTGEIIKTGVKTAKGVVGYDLTKLIVGSEGTLAIITEMTLRLLPKPQGKKTMTVVFQSIHNAAQTVAEIIRNAVIPCAIEYMDNAAIRCAEEYMKAGLPVDAGAILIVEVDGKEDATVEEVEVIREICLRMGATSFKTAKDDDEVKDLWKARKALSPALFLYGPDKINEDIVVPRSRIPDIVRKIEELKSSTGLTMVSFGHAGDGNIHFNIMLDKRNDTDFQKAKKAIEEVFNYTLELGGTISGEHGVGITKRDYISKEIGESELSLMRGIKKLFDPNGILNPGKIF